jgi:hypothetical protein
METSRDNGSAEEEQEVSRPAEDAVDEVIADSFPASDPPQWWAGPPD